MSVVAGEEADGNGGVDGEVQNTCHRGRSVSFTQSFLWQFYYHQRLHNTTHP